jgi:ribosomal protein S18 acetylase RimI-like enzyme
MTHMSIRTLEPRDLPGCVRLAVSGFGPFIGHLAHVDLNEAFSSNAWRPTFYVAEIDKNLVGMGAYNIAWLGYGIYSLTWLTVAPEFRRRGIAAALIDRRLADLKPMARLILVETPREELARFYEKKYSFQRLMNIPGELARDNLEVLLGWTERREGVAR